MLERKKLYHYVITIESPMINRMGTYADTVECNGTRGQAFQELFESACEKLGSRVDQTFVRHWSLERNEL